MTDIAKTIEAIKLLPCPFCGGEAEINGWTNENKALVGCGNEDCFFDISVRPSYWNTRPSLADREALANLQDSVWRWCEETFTGIAAWKTDKERAYRFFEEAGELFQAIGMTRDDALKVVDYVFSRPVGEKSQEIGGVMITLLALASQQGLSVNDAARAEYERITQPEVQNKIRDKQRAKNQAFL